MKNNYKIKEDQKVWDHDEEKWITTYYVYEERETEGIPFFNEMYKRLMVIFMISAIFCLFVEYMAHGALVITITYISSFLTSLNIINSLLYLISHYQKGKILESIIEEGFKSINAAKKYIGGLKDE